MNGISILLIDLSLLVYDEKLINFECLKKTFDTDNRLLFILNCINLSVTQFCQLSYNYINKYEQYDQFFINEYTKRYRSYVEAAIYLNEYLENLNVLVNYVYDANEQIYSTLPKFSVMRLMMTTWNREVYGKLGKIYSEKLSNLYEVYFSKEVARLNNELLFSRSEICEDSMISLCKSPLEEYRTSVSTNTTSASINSQASIYSIDSKHLTRILEW
jgi:hypothetical protein